MRPVAKAYSEYVPEGVRTGVHNVVQNLKEPAVAVNDLLQGNVKRAWELVQRLAVNTTVGGVGVVDMAAKWGLPPHKADFGQTLAVWGVGEGPFVELPLLGPSNSRDAMGAVVDMALNPLTFVGGPPATYATAATSGANLVDTRAQHLKDLDELERNSLDYYATLRSVYRQHRDAEIAAAKKPDEPKGQVDISFPNASPVGPHAVTRPAAAPVGRLKSPASAPRPEPGGAARAPPHRPRAPPGRCRRPSPASAARRRSDSASRLSCG